jgi:hypothetical protein
MPLSTFFELLLVMCAVTVLYGLFTGWITLKDSWVLGKKDGESK